MDRSVLAQYDFTSFGALSDLKHRDLWVPEQSSGNFFVPMVNANPWAEEVSQPTLHLPVSLVGGL